MRCKRQVVDVKFNPRNLKPLFDAVNPSEDEGCFRIENYEVYYAIVGREEFLQSGLDGITFTDEKSGELLKKWEEKVPNLIKSGSDFKWLVKPDWDSGKSEYIFYAFHRYSEPVPMTATYLVLGTVYGDVRKITLKRQGDVEKVIDIQTSLAFVNHSPSGFEWGYSGSGPAQASLSILLEILPSEMAVNNYMAFKNSVIAHLEMGKGFLIKIVVRKVESDGYFLDVTLDEQRKVSFKLK